MTGDWERCKPWLAAMIEASPFYTMESIERALADGSSLLWAGEKCAAITEILTFPKCKALNVFAVGGERGNCLKELLRSIEPAIAQYAKEKGCSLMMGHGIFEGWRPVVEGIGYRHLYTVMVKELE